VGAISPEKLIKFKDNLNAGCKKLLLISKGGDVDTAIEMGRLVRKKMIFVATEYKQSCASACVFVYAGGVQRLPNGKIEIHRPYLSSSLASYERTQVKYRALDDRIKKFLKEMNVNDELFNMMMAIKPEETKVLSVDEMEKLGMGQIDPVFDEYLDNAKAATAKMSKQSWMIKKVSTKNQCGDIYRNFDNSKQAEDVLACWSRKFPQWFVEVN
jgi:hypothetical protein